MIKKVHVKKGDTVVVNSGVDKGKKAKVLHVMPKVNRVIVEGVNIRAKHQKPRKQGEEGGIIKQEVAISAAKVNIYCSKCSKPVRTNYKIEDNKKIRVCKKCGSELK